MQQIIMSRVDVLLLSILDTAGVMCQHRHVQMIQLQGGCGVSNQPGTQEGEVGWQQPMLVWQVPGQRRNGWGGAPLDHMPQPVHTDKGLWLQPGQHAYLCLSTFTLNLG